MKQGHPFSLFFLILLFSWAGKGFGQDIIFNKVASPVGSPFIFVTGITQDVNGIMWFSTKSGLIRYDGNQLTTFKNNPSNPNSIMSINLESIFADSDGTIWIGSLGQGLDHFDPMTGIFTHYIHDPDNNAGLINDTVTQILRDKQGTLWIGTHGGLERFDQNSNTFFHYRHDPRDATSLSNNQVRVLYEDRQGILWIGTGSPYPDNGGGPEEGGLNKMNKTTGTFTRYMHDPLKNNSLLNNKVSAIYEDSEGVIWVGTAKNGFHKMNLQDGTFERIIYDPAHPEKLSGPPVSNEAAAYEHISFITQDAAGNYWIGSVYAGLNYFNPASGKGIHFHGNTNPAGGFTDYGVWSAFNSRDGIFWIGCPDPGGTIYRINPFRKEIPHYKTSSGYVTSFFEEPDGSLMIGTDKELIYKNTDFVRRFQNCAGPENSSDQSIRGITKDRHGDIWFGGGRGLTRWNKQDNAFFNYKHETDNPNSLSYNAIYTIYEDKKDNLWIGTFKGLNLLDRQTGLFTRYYIYPEDTLSFGRNFISSVFEDNKGNLWVSAWSGGGINLLNRADMQFKTYLKGVSTLLMYQDLDGILWACTEKGLYKYDAETDNFIRYVDPMSSSGIDNIFSMIEDDEGNLWFGIADGILRLNRARDEIRLFGKNYGVGNNGMSYGACYKGRDGKLYFGDGTGYFSFDPAKFVSSINTPEINITSFRLADQVMKPGDGGPLKESLFQTSEILLRYNQNVFSFDLNVIDYAYPEQNRLFYFLENHETEWHQANSDGKAYYFNIPPGKYTLNVKAVNGYGAWAGRKIDVIILPPWWRTNWAYTLYALIALAVVFGFDRFMRRRIVLAERRRMLVREIAQAKEIEKAYTELKATQVQLIQSEKMASLGELTAGIAHEIQNPLNFVNNFSEVSIEMIDELSQQPAVSSQQSLPEILNDIRENLQKIHHHGKRADAIVKGMLQHSRASTGKKEPTDINALCDEFLRLAYHGLRAKDKSFNATLKTNFDESTGSINVIPQDIGRVILNLITNAFYAVDEKKKQLASDLSALPNLTRQNAYEPTVTISTRKTGSRVEISVKDNGGGIPEAIKEKIFQPFFTTKPSGEGTGLGLSLSYDIITKGHGGELKVETKEGEGTEFIILLNTSA